MQLRKVLQVTEPAKTREDAIAMTRHLRQQSGCLGARTIGGYDTPWTAQAFFPVDDSEPIGPHFMDGCRVVLCPTYLLDNTGMHAQCRWSCPHGCKEAIHCAHWDYES